MYALSYESANDTKKQTTLSIMPPYSMITLLLAFAAGVTYAPAPENHLSCSSDPVYVGDTGTMTFYFRNDLNMSSDTFIAYVIRTGDTANVVQCDRRHDEGITCDTIHKAFKPTSIVNHRLTLTADNVNLDLAGMYTLWTMVGGSREPPVYCTFVVKNGREDTAGDTIDETAVAIAVPLVLIFVFATFGFGIYLYRRRMRQRDGRDKQQKTKPDHHGRSITEPMLQFDAADGHPYELQSKRWYFRQASHNFEAKLTKFWRNGEGSFLIAKDHDNFFTLAVLDERGNTRRPRIAKIDSGYNLCDTDNTFTTLSALVTYYKEHDIVIKKGNFGKLVKPFEIKPKDVWYAGKLEREDADNLFRTKGKTPGSFFIRDNITYSECYTLAVNVEGKMETFRISMDDESFILDDATGRKHFKSLAELVEYYQEYSLNTVKGDKGLLVRPIQVRSTCCPCI